MPIFKEEIEHLGHIISRDGIRVDPKENRRSKSWELQRNVKQVQSFLGLCNYYRKFVNGFAKIAAPLTNLTSKNNTLQWNKLECDSFNALNEDLTQAPVLKCADPGLEYQVTCDASDTGTGAFLTQTDEKGCRPVAYTSKS